MTQRLHSPTELPDETYVALDLETTGLDPQRDAIIEVGAVKFRGNEELGRFSSLVNPRRKLPPFITSLTGITQEEVDSAPGWRQVAQELRRFLADLPMVGHNVGFDVAFLRSNNVFHKGMALDTNELAYVALPTEPSYGLVRLAEKYAVPHDSPHRALSDAMATRDVFLELYRRLSAMDPAMLRQLQRMGGQSNPTIATVAGRAIDKLKLTQQQQTHSTGLDTRELARRLHTPRIQRQEAEPPDRELYLEQVKALFEPGGSLEKTLPAFELRGEQIAMARAVAEAIADGENLVVEAGTGVGKSIAYLAGAALHATSGGGTVIVSTNTINLQAQLKNKDVPLLKESLAAAGLIEAEDICVSELKGRSNYICYRRWAHAAQSDLLDDQTTRLAAKCLVWLSDTGTGDRSELRLSRQDGPAFAKLLSAEGAMKCPPPEGPCFLRQARNLAHSADVLIVNHALLMSDAHVGGGFLPPHDALVIDEAHHLLPVATNQLGFRVMQQQFEGELARLSGERGLIMELGNALQSTEGPVEALDLSLAQTVKGSEAARGAEERSVDFFTRLSSTYADFVGRGQGGKLRITDGLRAQPAWSPLEVAWENLDTALAVTIGVLDDLQGRANRAEKLDESIAPIVLNAHAALKYLLDAREALRQSVPQPQDGMVYWIEQRGRDRLLTLNAAPLEVGPILREKIFERERSVILTGGTLEYDGNIERFRDSVGLEGGKDLLLGSPFDYKRAALVAVPADMPEPGNSGYARAVSEAILDVALKLRNRILVLFTSYSALETARRSIAEPLGRAGIMLLAQGAGMTPHRVMQELARNEAAVALGTSSLWEGVDLEGASIKALIMARLPFPVPTDPVVEARAELVEDGFNEYMVPEAVVRFRQGFGRLIRSATDRGAFVVLDRRIIARGYGGKFRRALPECTVRRPPLSNLGGVVADWNAGRPV